VLRLEFQKRTNTMRHIIRGKSADPAKTSDLPFDFAVQSCEILGTPKLLGRTLQSLLGAS
jgi:hypothetical protein